MRMAEEGRQQHSRLPGARCPEDNWGKTGGLWHVLKFSFSRIAAPQAGKRQGRERKEREGNYVSRRAPAASGRCGRREGQGAAVGDVTWAPEAGAEVGVGWARGRAAVRARPVRGAGRADPAPPEGRRGGGGRAREQERAGAGHGPAPLPCSGCSGALSCAEPGPPDAARQPSRKRWGAGAMADTGSLHATRFEAAVKVIQSLPKNGECGGGVRRQRRHRERAGPGGRGGVGTAGPPRQRLGKRWKLGISAAPRLSGQAPAWGLPSPARSSSLGRLDQGICQLPAISASLTSSSCFNTAVTVSSPLLKELTKWKRKKPSDVIFLIRFMIITLKKLFITCIINSGLKWNRMFLKFWGKGHCKRLMIGIQPQATWFNGLVMNLPCQLFRVLYLQFFPPQKYVPQRKKRKPNREVWWKVLSNT